MVIWARLKMMPCTLRMITIVFWIAGVFAAIASVLPGWEDHAGRPISQNEFWSQGYGFGLLCTALGMIVIGILIYSARSWVRHLLMMGVIGILSYELIQHEYTDYLDSSILIVTSVVLIVAVWYLYFRRRVVSYFSRQNISAEQVAPRNR